MLTYEGTRTGTNGSADGSTDGCSLSILTDDSA